MILKPKEQKLIRVEAPFIDEISELAIVKILDKMTHSTMIIKIKFIQNLATLNVTNNDLDTIIFDLNKVLGIVGL